MPRPKLAVVAKHAKLESTRLRNAAKKGGPIVSPDLGSLLGNDQKKAGPKETIACRFLVFSRSEKKTGPRFYENVETPTSLALFTGPFLVWTFLVFP